MNQQPQTFYSDPLIYRNKQYVRQFLCTPVVLVLAILSTTQVALGILSSVVFAPIAADLTNFLENFLLNNYNISTSDTDTFSMSVSITSIAMPVAFFLMYFGAKKSTEKKPDEAGATIYWIVSILQLVGCIIGAVCYVLASLGFILLSFNISSGESSSYSSDAQIATAIIIALVIFLTLIIAVILVYGISEFMFASSIKKSLSTTNLQAKGAKIFGIFNVIFAVFSCFSVIISAILFFAVVFAAKNIVHSIGGSTGTGSYIAFMGINLVSVVISFAYSIYTAKFALGYSKHIEAAGSDGCNIPFFAASCHIGTAQPVYQVPATTDQTNPNPYYTAPATPQTNTTADTQSVPAPGFCTQCGNPVAPGHSFCANCGAKIL